MRVTILENQPYETLRTYCEECGELCLLTTTDPDGILIGDECLCGYYVTRYQRGMEPR